MKIAQFIVGVLTIAACHRGGQKLDTLPGPQLGESTASPGANPTKPAPLTPDDPRVMNVTAAIRPEQQSDFVTEIPQVAITLQQPAPPPPPAAPQPPPLDQARREQSPPNPATSSTPVQPPTDIAPATTTPDTNRPGVFAPPPPSQQ